MVLNESLSIVLSESVKKNNDLYRKKVAKISGDRGNFEISEI